MQTNFPVFNVQDSDRHITDTYNPRIADWISKNYSDKTFVVLDIGCASGALGKFLKQSCSKARVYGIEASLPALSIAKERLDGVWQLDLFGNLGELSVLIEKISPDVVVLADVLEHLIDVKGLLSQLYASLSDKAVICISLPNIFSYELFEKYSSGVFQYDALGIFDETHVRFYNYKSAIKLFHDHGFQASITAQDFLINPTGMRMLTQHLDHVAKGGEATIGFGDITIKCRSVDRLLELAAYGFALTARKMLK